MAVCQPGIPAMAAAALMAMAGNPRRPASLVLMGSPMDTARNPKQPNELAASGSLAWFENNVVVRVPWPNRGFMRRVYPGFLQLSSFLAMNIDRHVDAHVHQFQNLVRGDGDGAEQHRAFYDEYLAVMDLTAEFYLQTIDRVFQRRLMANGAYRYRDTLVETAAINDIGLMTIEGEKDDITGLGQTEAAHDMVPDLPEARRRHFVAEGVGHYGVFNGSRWRSMIEPQVRDFIRAQRRPRLSRARGRRHPHRRAGHRGSAAAQRAGAADGAARGAGGRRPVADPAAGRAARPGAGVPERSGGLAAAAPGGARRRARRWARARCCRSGTRTLTVRGAAGRPRRPARRRRSACPGRRRGMPPRVAAWLREEARRACVAAVARHAARWAAARARQPARPALALGLVHRDGRPDVLLAAGAGARRRCSTTWWRTRWRIWPR